MLNTITCDHWAMELVINPETNRIDSIEIVTIDPEDVPLDLDVTEKEDGWRLTGYEIRTSGYDDYDELKGLIVSAAAASQKFQTVINAIQRALEAL